jgi:hypothetical protein
MPYHNNIWINYQPTTTAMIEVEKLTIKLSKKLDIDIIGSFDPNKFNCSLTEFYDEMHARKECFIKIY